MKIALITAGAGGMVCGSCIRDNTLARELQRIGEDAVLIPTYTPIRTDEENFSIRRVFYGGINVYLQQRSSLFGNAPRFVEKLFDSPKLLKWVSRFSLSTDAKELGELTVSVLKGENGNQRKELQKLIHWLKHENRPDIVNLPNIMFGALAAPIKKHLNIPVVCTLQGDDSFLDTLPSPYKSQAIDLARRHAQQMDGFIAPCNDYAERMADYLAIERSDIHVCYLGLNLDPILEEKKTSVSNTFTIGYLARICPEKGLHQLVDAFRLLKKDSSMPPCKLKVAGYMGGRDKPYLEALRTEIQNDGLIEDFEYLGTVTREEKIRFLRSLDVFSVPTTLREPKGLFVLEALACGVPVIQPRHGSFPELIEMTNGGLLFEPGNVSDLVSAIRRLLEDTSLREKLGRQGRDKIRKHFTALRMANAVLDVYRKYVSTRR